MNRSRTTTPRNAVSGFALRILFLVMFLMGNMSNVYARQVAGDQPAPESSTSKRANALQAPTCYTLNLSFTGTGSVPTASPVNSVGCASGQFVEGESITLTASPGAGFTIRNWNGTINDSSTSVTNTVTMPAADHAAAVNYAACYTLTVSHTGTGSDPFAIPTISAGCTAGPYQYISGESITLAASPGAGFTVGSWTGTDNDASTSMNNSLIMPAGDHAVAVNYVGLPPGAFGKTSPANGATGQLTSVTLQWGTSSNVTNYEYCYDSSNDNACSTWIPTGTTTSALISGLSQSTIYYWHVRAVNSFGTIYSGASPTAFWSFTTSGPPGDFSKSSPANGAINQLPSLTLSWGTSVNATSYAYCYDKTNNNNCNPWIPVGPATSATISGLTPGTPFYWHVRANNAQGQTYSNGSDIAFWSFTTGPAPASFSRISPTNTASNQAISLNLSWGTSSNVDSYEYCYAAAATCSNWTTAGTNTSVAIGPLLSNTTYAWHVRALNVYGSTYAGGDPALFWTFTTGGAPGAFSKTSPADAAINQVLSLSLSWGASTNAVSYEYCFAAGATCSNWTDVGNVTTIPVGPLLPNTTYAWHVRAVNPISTVYSNGSGTAYWSFTTGDAPGAFTKTSPSSGAINQLLSLTLSWGASPNASRYDYCLAAGATCSNWTDAGNVTSLAVGPLLANTTYAWHIRAVNSIGTIYSDGLSDAFWTFTTGPAPGPFNKTAPANNATGQPLNPSLTWSASTNATSYEYCYATSTAGCTNWTSTGATSASLSGLSLNTTYFWNVRATNSFGTTPSNGGFFSFTTGDLPASFSKISPTANAANQPLSLSLTWGQSSPEATYEYCYAISTADCINWTSTGTLTSATISGLSEYTPYFWHVRATNSFGTTYSGGSPAAFRSFTTGGKPGPFNKTSPADGVSGLPVNPTLQWGAAANPDRYEYCYATSTAGCTNWTSTGITTSATLSNLTENTTYYWHVRAVNSFGETYSDGSNALFWSFSTGGKPVAFSKSSPTNNTNNQLLSLTLQWAASTNAASYEYCLAIGATCSNWTNVNANTSISVGPLNAGTTYSWHVRANNTFGTTYSNGSAATFWSFTTGPAPGPFNKTSPANAATGLPLSLSLVWGTSTNAASYEYCYATSTLACTNWTSTGTTSASLSGLPEYTTYYWHVRANNNYGQTYSDGPSIFRSFTTGGKPGTFNKISPAIAATGQPLSLSLTWGTSTNVSFYEYCYATSTAACDTGWTNIGTATSAPISGLAQYTTYYWHVRAWNSFGYTYSGGAPNAYRTFVTGGIPGSFNKSGPANGATNQPLTLSLSWNASSAAAGYEYCYDTTNDGLCGTWLDATNVTTVSISGLTPSLTYYWHVRAYNNFGTTLSNGGFWSFTTGSASVAFSKTSPTDGAIDQLLSLSLDWNPSSGATSYEYCYDSTNDGACSNWTGVGTATIASIGGLTQDTTYYWQVRANNSFGTTFANGSETAYWSFKTGPAPGGFNKTSPINTATDQLLSLTLEWGSSTGADSYAYCFATSTALCTTWINVGPATSTTISGLTAATSYYWNVRAVNLYGTTSSNGGFWSFTTGSKPGIFGKSNPANGATDQLLSLTLQWGASSSPAGYPVSYQYCLATSSTTCNNWAPSPGTTATSITISNLTHSTTYYWQVRAVNAFGTTHGDGSINTVWSFTTGPAPGTFGKSSPANGATNQPLSLTLQWAASTNAAGYQYCFATSTSGCTNWTSTDTTSAAITGLLQYKTYYWHVRAINNFGQVYSDSLDTAFWSFRTGGKPRAFIKLSPANAGEVFTAQPLNPTLTWGATSGTPGTYEYCYATSLAGCTKWISAGTATSVSLNGLQPSRRYYWQVRAVNSFGKTYSDGSASATWSFVTQAVCPAISAWKGEYWANNALSGPAVLCRDDADINFDWGYVSPVPPLSYDNFSVRWTRSINFATTGTYRFYLDHDDGARLFLDGVMKKDSWGTCCTVDSVDLLIGAGLHTIGLEMHEDIGYANAHLWWEQISQQFASIGAQDGWILESTETSGKGGTMNQSAGLFNLGDDALDKQYRTILSFDTSSLPNDAIITSVTLKIKQAGLVGTNPFTTHGNILVDMRKGGFNSNTALELADFQAAVGSSGKDAVSIIGNSPANGWYSKNLGPASVGYINTMGYTQFRLRFSLDDNDDLGADYLKFFSGNYTTAAFRPQLIILYTLP